MHHVGKNARSQAAALRIANAVVELGESMPISDISIAEACREAEVSRSCFYRLFDHPEDALAWLLGNIARRIASCVPLYLPGEPHAGVMMYLLSKWKWHQKVLGVLTRNGRTDLFEQAFRESAPMILKRVYPRLEQHGLLWRDVLESRVSLATLVLRIAYHPDESLRGRGLMDFAVARLFSLDEQDGLSPSAQGGVEVRASLDRDLPEPEPDSPEPDLRNALGQEPWPDMVLRAPFYYRRVFHYWSGSAARRQLRRWYRGYDNGHGNVGRDGRLGCAIEGDTG